MPSPMTLEELQLRLDLLEADLLTLRPLVIKKNSPVLEGEIRAASAILRRWLHEGQLGRLANGLGVSATLPTLRNDRIVAQLGELEDIDYYLAAGVAFNGRPVQSIYSSGLPFEGSPRLDVQSTRLVWVKPDAFLAQPCLYFEQRLFSRREVLLFTANKLGGVHFDLRRDEGQARLGRAATYMTFGGPPAAALRGQQGVMHLELEPAGREFLSGLHIEVVVAGAALLQVRFDDEPFLLIRRTPSLTERLRRVSGLDRRRLKARLHERT